MQNVRRAFVQRCDEQVRTGRSLVLKYPKLVHDIFFNHRIEPLNEGSHIHAKILTAYGTRIVATKGFVLPKAKANKIPVQNAARSQPYMREQSSSL